MDQEAQKDLDKQMDKKYYTIKLEALVPTTLTFKVLAKDEKEALEKMQKELPISHKPNFMKRKNIKAIVYEFGNLLIKLTKNY